MGNGISRKIKWPGARAQWKTAVCDGSGRGKTGRFLAAGAFREGSIASAAVAGFAIPVTAVFQREANLRALRRLLD